MKATTQITTSTSLCQECVWETHTVMLTTYCLRAKCDRCHRHADLAMVYDSREDAGRLDAARATEQFKHKTRQIADLSESPLFGGPKQKAMFDEEAI